MLYLARYALDHPLPARPRIVERTDRAGRAAAVKPKPRPRPSPGSGR